MPNRLCVLFAVSFFLTPPAGALAQGEARPSAEAEAIARGWSLLAKGDASGAAAAAAQAIARDRLSPAAVMLATEAELARGSASTTLTTYEKWLSGRTVDAPYVLRRVARAMLVEAGVQKSNVTARLDALTALAADGDPDAAAALERAAQANAFGETRALASMGNERAVTRLVEQLESFPGGRTSIIDALGQSGSTLAVAPLRTLLSDPTDVNRAAAAEALGRLGATEAIPQLRALLKDPMFPVKLKAAGALFLLNDSSGLPFLTEVAASDHAAIRVAAARELAAQPDTVWQAMVRALTADPDPAVRLDAARLLAPYDAALARTVLDALMRDDNLSIREAASGVFVERVASDFQMLRAMLRNGDIAVRVKAAARILELTR
jgi:hypothetical protein